MVASLGMREVMTGNTRSFEFFTGVEKPSIVVVTEPDLQGIIDVVLPLVEVANVEALSQSLKNTGFPTRCHGSVVSYLIALDRRQNERVLPDDKKQTVIRLLTPQNAPVAGIARYFNAGTGELNLPVDLANTTWRTFHVDPPHYRYKNLDALIEAAMEADPLTDAEVAEMVKTALEEVERRQAFENQRLPSSVILPRFKKT